jgi:eukaryotic-like serine/threonine-protein kinase
LGVVQDDILVVTYLSNTPVCLYSIKRGFNQTTITMNPSKWQQVESVLDQILELNEPERTRYVNEQIDDAEIKKEVLSLLQAELDVPKYIDEGVEKLLTNDPDMQEIAKSISSRHIEIDRYKIVKEIGRGGMSLVYLARRTDGEFDQEVAIKLIQPFGRDREDRFQRLRAERQILAGLQHPNIARVFDGGVTPEGWPYMVMEVVNGIPIIQYCREKKLDVTTRLKLFQKVCDAVIYAHRNLVVHRDLKPGNILITDEGDVKLLDFGIAKLLVEDEHSENLTQFGSPLLTPEYAAPEQFLDRTITTSVDVYSLGVLLYELLAGIRPYDLSEKSLKEIEQLVCEQEPLRPSSVASDPSIPSDKLKGDLDVICLKSLRKEPEKRYGSVQELQEDITRTFNNLPIAARSASSAYRIRKHIQRHRVGVAVTALFLLMIAGFVFALIYQQALTLQERDRAIVEAQKAEQITEFLVDLFENANPILSPDGDLTAIEILEVGLERAETLSDQADVTAKILNTIGKAFHATGQINRAFSAFQKQVEILSEHYGDSHPEVGIALGELGWAMLMQGDFLGATEFFQDGLTLLEKNESDYQLMIANLLHGMGLALNGEGHHNKAADLLRESTAIRREVLGNSHPDLSNGINDLGIVLRSQGDLDGAEWQFREAIAMRQTLLNPEHPLLADSFKHLADILRKKGNFKEAAELIAEIIEIQLNIFGETHPKVALSYHNLAHVLNDVGDVRNALINNQKAVEIMQNQAPAEYEFSDMLQLSAILYDRLGNVIAAEDLFLKAVQNCKEIRSEASTGCSHITRSAGEFFYRQQQFDKASDYLREAYNSMCLTYEAGHVELKEVEGLLGVIDVISR